MLANYSRNYFENTSQSSNNFNYIPKLIIKHDHLNPICVQIETLFGTPLHVTPGSELGASNSYGNTPAPHRFRRLESVFLLSISFSIRLISAENSKNSSVISASLDQIDGCCLSPRYSSSGECVDNVSTTAIYFVACNKLGNADRKYFCGSAKNTAYSGSFSSGINLLINGGRLGT